MMNEESELKKREILRLSNEESHRLTLECIRSALLYLMGTKNYEKITISDIIRKSGVSRAAFYRNYESKDAVLQDALTEVTEFLQESFAGSMVGESKEESLVQFFREIQRNRSEVELLFKAKLDAEQIFDRLPKAELAGDPMGKYRAGIYISSLWAMVGIWMESGFRETPEELAEFVMKVFVVE